VADDETDPVFGVANQRTGNPVNPPPIDRQRLYMGQGGDIGMGAKARGKTGAGPMSATRAKPQPFSVRQRTLRKG
jgi:hypothetical protein